jgi:hypothetical protein
MPIALAALAVILSEAEESLIISWPKHQRGESEMFRSAQHDRAISISEIRVARGNLCFRDLTSETAT